MGTTTPRRTAALLSLATVATGLTVTFAAAPAEAGWTDVSGVTRYRICKQPAGSGAGWVLDSRVRVPSGSGPGRAGVVVRADGERRGRWGSGWLEGGERAVGTVRVRRPGSRLRVRQEAGDPDSMIGTALEVTTLRLRDLRRCG